VVGGGRGQKEIRFFEGSVSPMGGERYVRQGIMGLIIVFIKGTGGKGTGSLGCQELKIQYLSQKKKVGCRGVGNPALLFWGGKKQGGRKKTVRE